MDPVALHSIEVVAGPGGELWLRIGDRGFPENGWYDLPFTLDRWIPPLLTLVSGTPGRAELTFHDGPFRADIVSDGSLRWEITLVAHRRRTHLTADGSRLGRSLLGAIRCAATDTNDLTSWFPHLQRALDATP